MYTVVLIVNIILVSASDQPCDVSDLVKRLIGDDVSTVVVPWSAIY